MAEVVSERNYAKDENIAVPDITVDELKKRLETPDQVAERVRYAGAECLEITYASKGLVIAGYLWKPRDTAGKALPLIIANRGGNSGFGAMSPWYNMGWFEFVEAGYVVLASQYRGGPGSEGADEFGGRDLDDVKSLFPLAEQLGYVDMKNVFMFGGSRGGMTTYMLAREGVPVRAIALRAGLADLERAADARPIFRQTWPQRMTDYAADPKLALQRRSAAAWASEITTPAILFHGTADWRLSVQDPLDVAQGLAKAGTPFEIHLYDGDGHGIMFNRLDMMQRTISFFEAYKAR